MSIWTVRSAKLDELGSFLSPPESRWQNIKFNAAVDFALSYVSSINPRENTSESASLHSSFFIRVEGKPTCSTMGSLVEGPAIWARRGRGRGNINLRAFEQVPSSPLCRRRSAAIILFDGNYLNLNNGQSARARAHGPVMSVWYILLALPAPLPFLPKGTDVKPYARAMLGGDEFPCGRGQRALRSDALFSWESIIMGVCFPFFGCN